MPIRSKKYVSDYQREGEQLVAICKGCQRTSILSYREIARRGQHMRTLESSRDYCAAATVGRRSPKCACRDRSSVRRRTGIETDASNNARPCAKPNSCRFPSGRWRPTRAARTLASDVTARVHGRARGQIRRDQYPRQRWRAWRPFVSEVAIARCDTVRRACFLISRRSLGRPHQPDPVPARCSIPNSFSRRRRTRRSRSIARNSGARPVRVVHACGAVAEYRVEMYLMVGRRCVR